MDQANTSMTLFKRGCISGLSIAIGYFPIAVTFGLIAFQQGQLTLQEAVFMSVWVFAGASQYIAVELIAAGVTAIEIIVATFILNLRHFLMSTVLSQQLNASRWNGLFSFGITDETFAVVTMSEGKDRHSPFYFAGIMLVAYSSWILGTVAGVLFAGWIPDPLRQSMGIALYAMFIGLLIPAVRRSWKIASTAGLGALCSWVASQWLSTGWSIVVATLLTATVAMLIFEKGKKTSEANLKCTPSSRQYNK